jgi:hypothetical protein
MNRFFLFCISIFSYISIFSSHVPGGNITYQCVGPNTFIVTLTLFEECGTAFETNSPEPITITNDCGYNSVSIGGASQLIGSNVLLQNSIFQQEISQLCISSTASSQCNGGTLPGFYMHVWEDTIVLPGPCDSWTFSYSSCCRNQSNNLSGNGSNYYWESILNSNTASCNSSPVINTPYPLPLFCFNQPASYSLSAYDSDCNTLVYSLVDALTDSGTSASYAVPYSGSSPISGITIDANTGLINFTPTITGRFVIVVKIEEFDSQGNLLGSVLHDFQFEVVSTTGCTNNYPTPNGISNLSSAINQISPYEIEFCQGSNVCFDLEFIDLNASDSIFLSSAINTAFPGATFTQNTFVSPATATICFDSLFNCSPSTIINIDARDNSCTFYGINTMTINVNTLQATYTSNNVTICQGFGTQLNVFGGSNFNWSVISGDSINIGTNFSCNNCQDPIATPSLTTVYEVTSNLSGGCSNIDTIQVTVVPDFTYSLTQSSATTCLNNEIQLNVSTNPNGAYTYLWSPGIFLNSINVADPLVLPTVPGNYDYEVQITSLDGCLKTDTISINVAAAYAPSVTLTASDSSVFCGDTVFMNVDLGGGFPAVCGLSAATTCSAASSQQTIGTSIDTNSYTSWPAPFGNWYKNAKHQFLFTAAELQASGFIGGKITEIAWETIAQNGATATFQSYTIKMGCTSATAINTWQAGLSTVFSPQNINVVLGWNNLVLTSAYEWDGISNLIVEICYDNLSLPYTNNWGTPYTTTSFNSVVEFHSDNTPACPYTTSQTVYSNRPVTRFTSCPTTPDPNNFSYQWTPSTFLSSANTIDPYALPLTTTTYELVVMGLNGGCSDTNFVTIDVEVLCDTCFPPSTTVIEPFCYGDSTGSILINPFGQHNPWTIHLIDVSSGINIEIDSNVVSNSIFNGLIAGDYVISILDTNGCNTIDTITVSQPPQMNLNTSGDTSICVGDSALLAVFSSGGTPPYNYYWNNGNSGNVQFVTPSATTNYIINVSDTNGCGNISDSITVYLNTVNTTTSINGNVLSAAQSGASYQWLDCDNNFAAISGEINQTFTANANGNYAVQVTDNGCLDSSACTSVTGIGILENSFGENFKVFPNPTSGNLSISLGDRYSSIRAELFSINGKSLGDYSFNNTTQIELVIDKAAGYYFIEIDSNEGEKAVIKVLKQ